MIIATALFPSLFLSLFLSLSPSPSLPHIDHKTLNARPIPHDLPSQSHDQLEELAVEVLEQLQSEQVSLDQYCSSVIASTAPLLPGYLNRQLTWATSEGEGPLPLGGAGGQSVAAHLAVTMELLSAVVELMDTQRSVAGDKDSLTEVYMSCEYMFEHIHV